MIRLSLLPVLLLCSACATPLAPPATPVTNVLTLNRVVRFEHRVVNAGEKPGTVEMFLAIPRDNERQKIRFFRPDPTFIEELTDDYGNRILHYLDHNVPAGDVVAHGWIAEVEISSFVSPPLGGPEVGGLAPDCRKVFLQDGENYQITSEAVGGLARTLAADSPHDGETVRRIYDHMIKNVRYVRDDVWDPAPVVLERRSGSCSEYNYAFLALCRAAGIPARYTGGIILSSRAITKYDATLTEDAVFHRWSEAFLPGRGWTPVDCSRGSSEVRRFGNPDNYFGRLPAGALQCMRGDGLGNAPLGWDYISNQKLPYVEEKDWSAKVGFWISGVEPGKLAARCEAIGKALFDGQDRGHFAELCKTPLDREILFFFRHRLKKQALPALIEALRDAGHPEAVYWSLLSAHRGMEVPEKLAYPALCGPYLKEQIEKYYAPKGEGRDLFTFEYWWRKARPKTRWSEKKKAFELVDRKINIY